MKRSKEVLERAGDVLFGRKRGSGGERGWGAGAYLGPDMTVCLNAALRVAERDVLTLLPPVDTMGGQYADWHAKPMATEEGVAAQRMLAQAILDMFPEVPYDHEVDFDMSNQSFCHQVIVGFNDHMATHESINAVLEQSEKLAWEAWVNEDPLTGLSPRDEHDITYRQLISG